jgi:hypothetical protein
MTEEKFIEGRKLLLDKKAEFEKQVNIEYTELSDIFIKAHSPVERLKVYELKKNGRKRRGYNRFVIYSIVLRVWDETVMITVGGWWLDKESIPTKWDNMTVLGVGNPAIFELAEDQTNYDHPDKNSNSDDSH